MTFGEFFSEVYGQEAFPWQMRLAARVEAEGRWPEVLDLPTGTGKTAVLDIAVYCLSRRPETFGRRIFFCVDRRLVVDQVCSRGLKLAKALEEGAGPAIRVVREGLRNAGGILRVAALRGGIPLDAAWSERPDRPWLVACTVDHLGSRLLFRGYGVHPRMRSVHAGLAGTDSLIVLDEVHLSGAFAETLKSVKEWNPPRFAVVEMSATPGPKKPKEEVFALTPDDLQESAELRRRVEANRKAVLAGETERQALPGKVAELAAGWKGADPLGVIVNRVASAREVHEKLAQDGWRTWLLAGRMRPLDRLDLLEELGPIVDPDGRRPVAGSAISSIERESGSVVTPLDCAGGRCAVVATQAIEIGADFSFGALITECAPADALMQRFGRMDRRGRRKSRGWIVRVNSEESDPVYGEAVEATWRVLEKRAADNVIDVAELKCFPAECFAERARAPLLTRACVESWMQTRPGPVAEPGIEPWLHGIGAKRMGEVSLVWRNDLSAAGLRAVPPREGEFLNLPVGAAQAWLSSGAELPVADAGGGVDAGDGNEVRDCVIWRGPNEELGHPTRLKAGDIVVVPCERSGLRAGTWNPNSREPVTDLGDRAQLASRRATIRLWGEDAPIRPGEESELEPVDRIRDWLQERHEGWVDEAAARILEGRMEVSAVEPVAGCEPYFVVSSGALAFGDGSDLTAATGEELGAHLQGVGRIAREMGTILGLSEPEIEALEAAGLWHDAGKTDERMQWDFSGGVRDSDRYLAKPMPGVPGRLLGAGRVPRRFPSGARHEAASVNLAAQAMETRERDLVLHLIASHHGWARPVLPLLGGRVRASWGGAELDADLAEGELAAEVAERFWRLSRRYGPWGLARLEAVFRLADHRRSEKEGNRR